MKLLQRTFYINVEGVRPNDIPGYIDAVKQTCGPTDHDTEAKVPGLVVMHYFIPIRHGDTRIETEVLELTDNDGI